MSLATQFADQGTRVSVLTFDQNQIKSKLTPAVYSVGFNPMAGFFLNKEGSSLPVPEKIYGAVNRKVSKILSAYERATKSLGILLSGDKGSGKTMTSSVVANECIKHGLPVILVDSAFDGAGLASFIDKLGECVVFIDEFGKKFDDDDGAQGELLGMFDGSGSSKRLVLLTENSIRDINKYMLNRPGRVHYHFRHDKLDEQIIREYCKDRVVDEATIEQICLRREASNEFSFDVLQAIVNEFLAFGGNVTELCDDLNIERPFDHSSTDIDIVSIKDLTANVDRHVSGHDAIAFPSSNDRTPIQIKSLDDPEDTDFFALSVREIVKKEGEIYTFATRCYGHDLVIKARQIERQHAWSY